jgi:hypothetical protein
LRPIHLTLFPARERGTWRRLVACAVIALAIVQPTSIAAHLQPLAGRLVDLVRRSDLVVVGVITRPGGPSPDATLQIEIEKIFLGAVEEKSLEVRCAARLGVGERHVVFLTVHPEGFLCAQSARSRFPASAVDDADYERTLRALANALRLPEAKRIPALRAALIPALRASAMELRYHAGLELVALNHPDHPLNPEERQAIAAIRNDTHLDPALRLLLERLLARNP